MRNKYLSANITFFCFIFCAICMFTLSGCEFELLEGLSAEEIGTVESESAGLASYGLEASEATGEVVVADEPTFYNRLSRVQIEPQSSRLYITENGVRRYFGDVVDSKEIKLDGINKNLNMPGKIYRVIGEKVNVRVGPGTDYSYDYKLFKHRIYQNQLVLVAEEEPNGWYKIMIGKNDFAYVCGLYLLAPKHRQQNNVSNTIIDHPYKPMPTSQGPMPTSQGLMPTSQGPMPTNGGQMSSNNQIPWRADNQLTQTDQSDIEHGYIITTSVVQGNQEGYPQYRTSTIHPRIKYNAKNYGYNYQNKFKTPSFNMRSNSHQRFNNYNDRRH